MSSMTLEGSIAAAARLRPSAQAAAAAAGPARRFAFTGQAAEYAGIWTINIFLTIVTLGIYSAWAKARTNQYFYGNIQLQGTSLQYLAKPLQILKGRILIFAGFAAWTLISDLYAEFDLVVVFLILPAVTPWVVVRALRFTTRNTAWRNIRFDFAGSTREAFGVHVLLWAGSVLSLGLLHPYAVYRRKRYWVENARYGETRFAFDGEARAFFQIYLVAAAVVLPFLLIAGALAAGSGLVPSILDSLASGSPWYYDGEGVAELGLAALLLGCGILIATTYLRVAVANTTWNHTRIGGFRFCLELGFARVLWIKLTNLVAILLSAGIMIPWARVRMARYQVGQLQLAGADDLERFAASEVQRLGATGAEIGAALEMDLGL